MQSTSTPTPRQGALSGQSISPDETKATGQKRSQSEVHAFRKQNGEVIIAVWLRSPTAGEIPDNSGTLEDRRRETADISAPGADGFNLSVRDHRGAVIKRSVKTAG